MAAAAAFFRWLGTPIRHLWGAFPLTRAGRQSLIYITFSCAGPALTLLVMWAMKQTLDRPPLWPTFSHLSEIVAAALLIVVTGLAMFVSIRAVRIGKDGFEASGEPDKEEAEK